MKFLHAADIHLGSALPGFVERTSGELPEDADVTRLAFSALVDLARREEVAFVVIAGDLYDREFRDARAGRFFAEEMVRLGRPCFLLRDNYEAASVIPGVARLPAHVREFGASRCETFILDDARVALHDHSFANRAVPEDLSAGYCPSEPGMVNIGVLHTSAEGADGHDTYAPCTAASLALRGYDYWALGHVHARQTLHEGPWVVFPGNTQGRHVRETGPN